ncbi:hypothetical protein [Pseudomonas mangiferae]|uniref:Uncharacterized protein n=1 Tax=Pseudomonas mangiferae TaxID=2593654 RepID=A0A553H0L2_9PSED|nr:hypothetical protein [Pseudomonas mangiferae]TRX75279.1 hypothetical protein FM069_09305 [Pseudomonas mangiferae]
MAIIDEKTLRGLPLPHPENDLGDDVLRLRTALVQIDALVAELQPLRPALSALAELSPAANKLPFFSSASAAALTTLSAWVRSNLLTVTSADGGRAALGLGTAATRTVGMDTGNLLEVGALGLGAALTSRGVFDLDNAPLGTWIAVNGNQADAVANHWPPISDTAARWWNVFTTGQANRVTQLALHGSDTAGTPLLAVRFKQDATWSAWVMNWHSGNFNPATKLNVGAGGIGATLDLRTWKSRTPANVPEGSVRGFMDGGPNGLAIPGLTATTYGIGSFDKQWPDISGAGSWQRRFETQGRVWVSPALDDNTWGNWQEIGNVRVRPLADLGTVIRNSNDTLSFDIGLREFFTVKVLPYSSGPGFIGTTTVSFDNIPDISTGIVTWHVEIQGGSQKTIAWPNTVKWTGGTPALNGAGKRDLFMFYRMAGRATVYGMLIDSGDL